MTDQTSLDGLTTTMIKNLQPESTVVVPTAGLVYVIQKRIQEIHGGPFRQKTKVVIVNKRGDADKLKHCERVVFDHSCDEELGSAVAMAEMRRARTIVAERTRHLKLATIAGGNVNDFIDTEVRASYRLPREAAE
jgi:hypothetical protein